MSPTSASLYPRRELTLANLANLVQGSLSGNGDPQAVVTGLTTLEEAGPEHVSFLANLKFAHAARASRAGAILIPKGAGLGAERAVIEVGEVWAGVLAVLNYFCPPPIAQASIHPSAVVAAEAMIGRDVTVGPLAVIEAGARVGDRSRVGAQCYIGRGAVLGEDVLLHPHVTIHEGVELGKRVIIHSGAVLGADGFKYEVIGGRLRKIPQVGTVMIEDDVEIGANATIDRASLTETRVGARTKMDNLSHLAHNVSVGSDCLIIAQVGVAGSTRIGRGCILAGQVGVADNVTITDGVRLGAQSGVKDSILEPGDYLGSPPLPARDGARVMVSLKRLPDLIKKVRELERRMEK